MFGVTVNYFSSIHSSTSTKQSVFFALSLLKNCSHVSTIVLSDGSEAEDHELRKYCESINVHYAHQGRLASFGDTYNYGACFLKEDWIALMASDIYVYPATFSAFDNFIKNHHELPIGCLIPYLSTSDLLFQMNQNRLDAYASLMTYNLNIFRRDVFLKIGGVNTMLNGCFNDIVTCIQLKKNGLDVFIVGGSYALHYGRLTVGNNINHKYIEDEKLFITKYPEYYDEAGYFKVKTVKFFKSNFLKVLFHIDRYYGNRKFTSAIIKHIPFFQKI